MVFSLTCNSVSQILSSRVPALVLVLLCLTRAKTLLDWVEFIRRGGGGGGGGETDRDRDRDCKHHRTDGGMPFDVGLLMDQFHKSQNAPVPYPTMLHSGIF